MKFTNVALNMGAIQAEESAEVAALLRTADAIKTDLQQSQTMPFDTGAMQNRNTYVDDRRAKQGEVSVCTDTPYARRLYFHPEYNFQTAHNPYADAFWFETYINGEKQDLPQRLFAKFLRQELKT